MHNMLETLLLLATTIKAMEKMVDIIVGDNALIANAITPRFQTTNAGNLRPMHFANWILVKGHPREAT